MMSVRIVPGIQKTSENTPNIRIDLTAQDRRSQNATTAPIQVKPITNMGQDNVSVVRQSVQPMLLSNQRAMLVDLPNTSF